MIVGASQGLGAELAKKLYSQGCSVVLVSRSKAKLDVQIKTILDTYGSSDAKLYSVGCDASDYSETENLWKEIVIDLKIDPDYIFCCAGAANCKLFKDLTGAELSSGVDQNYKTAMNVVHSGFKQILEITPDLLYSEHKKRHIILFSLVLSYFPFIGYSHYAPMKSAVTSFSAILRQELGPYNFRISCVFPGNFASEGYAEEERTKPAITKTIEGSSVPILVEACADLVFNRLNSGYDSITTDFIGWFLGSASLGILPREWGVVQVLFSLILLIIMPIVNWFIYGDIKAFFKKRSQETPRKKQKGSSTYESIDQLNIK